MVVPQLRCRSECFDLVSVEVEMQPDREHAERDDAAVEVAAHCFVSLSRGSSASAVSRRWGQDLVCSGI